MTELGIHIDFDKCNYCFECVKKCRVEALTEQDGEIIINREVCQRCESCTYECSENAMWIEYPKANLWVMD